MEENEEERLIAAERDRRRRLAWTTALLLIGLPIYILVASWLAAEFVQPAAAPDGSFEGRTAHWALELLIYVGLGVLWAFPLKRLVMGLGKKPK